MCILDNKIKFEIDINNDELLKKIWEQMKEIKRGKVGERDIIKLIRFHRIYHYSFFFS
jgi:hypothetical protein